MRLVLCVDTWGLIGGSERYAGAAAAELAAMGHSVHVVAARLDRGAPAPAELACEIVPAWGDRRASRAQLASLAARVARFTPDAVLVLSCASERSFEALLDVAPLVRFVQDHTPICPGLNKLKADGSPCSDPLGSACLSSFLLGAGCHGFQRSAQRSTAIDAVGALRKHLIGLERLARSAQVLVASDYMRRELLAAGLPAERVARVPYFTQSGTLASPRGEPDRQTREFLAQGDAPLILAPARLALPDKGIDHLLDALAACEQPLRAVIAGSGPAEACLREKARAAGLDGRVHFGGWQAPAALESLYAASDLVAFPSVWDEPFGLVGLEAMAHGKPVVAFDVGGVREWLAPGRTGLIVERRDSRAFAGALDALLADPERARDLGRQGASRAARRFSLRRGVRKLELQLERAARTGRVRRVA